MTKLKILILDDTEQGATATERSLKTGLGISGKIPKIFGDELRTHLEEFWKFAIPALKGKSQAKDTRRQLAKTWHADIVFIDNNLTELPPPGKDVYAGPLTAEAVIGFLRAFAPITYVVSLNRYPEVSFDLTALVGDRTTVADLAANTDHLACRGLWKQLGANSNEFKPSYWPQLTSAAVRRSKQITAIHSHLDSPLLPLIGIDIGTKLNSISDRALGALSPDAGREMDNAANSEWSKLTVREFFRSSCRSLASDIRETLKNDDDVVASIAASEIESWIRRDLLAPQDAIATIPHLVSRMPFLLKPNASKLGAWNKAASSERAPFGLNASRYGKLIKPYLTKFDVWLGTQTCWWDEIKNSKELSALYMAEAKWGDFVYCEDISRFRERRAGKTTPREFTSDVDGAWRRRFVARRDPGYSPAVRFSI